VAEGDQAPVLLEPGEAAEPAARHVLEEDALHGGFRGEGEDAVERRVDEVRHRPDPAV
jgi:hypothetical protein